MAFMQKWIPDTLTLCSMHHFIALQELLYLKYQENIHNSYGRSSIFVIVNEKYFKLLYSW